MSEVAVSVVLADDHPMFLEGLKLALMAGRPRPGHRPGPRSRARRRGAERPVTRCGRGSALRPWRPPAANG